MRKTFTNYAFIDSQNLNLGIKKLGWQLDFRRFRIYLKEKYAIQKAYLFLGYIHRNKNLYRYLRRSGYHLVFKPVLRSRDGKIKGNCDAELVLQAMIDFHDYEKAIVVTGDGDFACLIRYLYKKSKLERLLIPNSRAYSSLLKPAACTRLEFLDSLRQRLKRTP